MNKYILLAALTAGMYLTGCDDESSSGSDTTKPAQFDELCKNSGGEFDNGICVCDGVKCDAGDLCNNSTKQCPVHVDPDQFKTACTESGGTPEGSVCKCGDETCASWQTCVDGHCPVLSAPDFSLMCSYSGGTLNDGVCSCNDVSCEAGALCNMTSGLCSSSSAVVNPSGNCNGFIRTCTNNAIGVGTVSDCISGVEFQRSCGTVSCNEDKTDCGECLNDNTTCRNDDNLVGKLISCTNGKKHEESCENVSCDGNKCGSCLNYTQVCEDEQAYVEKVVLNDDGTIAKNDDGSTKTVKELEPAVGRLYECKEGRKGNLLLDCENVSCKRKRAFHKNPDGTIWHDTDGTVTWEYDAAETMKRGYNVYVMEPLDTNPVCGECLNFAEKCENDLSDFAVMSRCQGGNWLTIELSDDPSSPFNIQKVVSSLEVTGYRPGTGENHGENSKWWISVGKKKNGSMTVSCNPTRTAPGVCHNSVQVCINRTFGKHGYIVKCENGRLAHYDSTPETTASESYIACQCKESYNNNGGCSTSRNCYSAQNAGSGVAICMPPGSCSGNNCDPEWDPNN